MDFNFTKKNWVPPIFFVFILNKLFDQIHIINFFLLFSIFMINILVINIPENSLCPVGLLHVDWFLRYVKYKNDFNFTKKNWVSPIFFLFFYSKSNSPSESSVDFSFLDFFFFSFPSDLDVFFFFLSAAGSFEGTGSSSTGSFSSASSVGSSSAS